ncbi:peptidoglycan D,D-transpeptidase FtsI family protein [Phycisphaerales bacterium AB-hyl4]|uniref:beta-lactamase n=1 Tax=Natronomicrosphaera hydrolytica TaxID=3242702 RepID=A0ABV4U332_9BACT
MRRLLRNYIPSMFHRRLLLLVVVAVAVVITLTVQTARLTVGEEHQRARAAVQSALEQTQFIPTVRGRVLDRYGRVLAEDESAYDVAVSYTVIVGDWPYHAGLRAARQANRRQWAEMGPSEREALGREYQRQFEEQVDMLWQTLAGLSDVDRAELEERKDGIRRRVQREASYLWARWHEQKRAELGEDVPFSEAVQPIRAQRQAHPLLFDVSPHVRGVVESFMAEAGRDPALQVWGQVEVRRPNHRRYPMESITVEYDRSTLPQDLAEETTVQMTVEGVGVHLLGAMRPAWREDFARRPMFNTDAYGRRQMDLGGYRDGDRMGSFGIERSMEDILRGLRGRATRRRDTGHEQRIEPEPGRDVRMTIDIQLQARVQGLLSPEYGLLRVHEWHGVEDVDRVEGQPRIGDPLNATAVVLEVHSGEVLAAVGTPGFTRDQLLNDPQSVWNDGVEYRWVNRPIARPYMPGSTLKTMILAAAYTEGLITPQQTIDCEFGPGQNNRFLRCWVHSFGRGHGPMNGAQSLQHSCNVYFYRMGDRLGTQGTYDWLSRFGVGQRTGAGIVEEVTGSLRSAEDMRYSDHVFLGIGQGPVAWTVLQSAAAYAALGRDGEYIRPTFIADPSDARPDQRPVSLGIARPYLRSILDGLERAASERGGTVYLLPDNERIFNVEGVRILAKSGTAQTQPSRLEDPDGNISHRRGNHAWTIALVQPEGDTYPTHVVSVVVEHGGSGGRVAGPVVNQIVHALRTEGYF